MLSSEVIILIAMLNIYRILHTAREKRTTEKDRTDYVFIKQEQYEEDVTKVC
jgi:guanylate kinase